MSKLTAGMFDSKTPDSLFGIKSGQGGLWWHVFNVVVFPSETRWFNKDGIELASGGLTVDNVRAILEHMPEGEYLFMLSGKDQKREEQSAVTFVAENCNFILAPKGMLMVLPSRNIKLLKNDIHGVDFAVFERAEVAGLLSSGD